MAESNNPSLVVVDKEEHCFGKTMQLLTSAWVAQVLNTAVRLDVLEIIAKAGGDPVSASEIASRMPNCKNPDASDALDRVLSLLAGHSVVDCSVVHDDGIGDQLPERRYSLGPIGKYFVKHQYGGPLVPLLAHAQGKVLMDLWYELDAAVLEGANVTAFEKAHGASLFKYAAGDPIFSDTFYKAMFNSTQTYITRLLDLDSYKGFENLTSLVDVGGGLGYAVAAIASKNPHIKGINFDLPRVVEQAPSHPGVEHRGGNMFESVPEADAIFMMRVLHNWDDNHCLKLLKNCYEALPENGKVISVEGIAPVNPANSDLTDLHTLKVDVLMMGLCDPKAKARSQSEFLALATKAGFRGIRFEFCICALWLMELYK